jgi:hypothetical protein
MAKNDFLKKRDERDRRFFEAGMKTGAQFATDYIALSLHDPEVMGKTRILSGSTIGKVLVNAGKLDEHFCLAFSDHVEADYVRNELDRALREVFGDDTVPFEKRYPYAKD